MPPFQLSKYRAAAVDWIIMANQPFTELSNKHFLKVVKTVNPNVPSISKDTVHRDILAAVPGELAQVKHLLEVREHSCNLLYNYYLWALASPQ